MMKQSHKGVASKRKKKERKKKENYEGEQTTNMSMTRVSEKWAAGKRATATAKNDDDGKNWEKESDEQQSQ